MEPLVCFPEHVPPVVGAALRECGLDFRAAPSGEFADALEQTATKDGWAGAVVSATDDLSRALAFCRQLRRREDPVSPLLLVIADDQLRELQLRDDLFDDFCVLPSRPAELAARLEHLLWRAGRSTAPDVIEHGPLVLNLETYQAAVAGRVLDLTYMEYELLRFLAAHPGKVFTRETLLSRVWGYEYYGGARTVDVHVRRLRAKLGEEHAHLIQTVRSVGYRFGQPAWSPVPGQGGTAGSPSTSGSRVGEASTAAADGVGTARRAPLSQ
ncbi:MAG TPA: response regulator transcription factor [Acidimicrobiales bacterium]|nr:response regulator transcription factor [Acidimicrobiales bacterium]